MFQSVRSYVNDILKETTSTQAYLNKLYGARRRINNAIKKGEVAINDLIKTQKKLDGQNQEFVATVKTYTSSVLFNKFLEAVKENTEFKREPYYSALLGVIEDFNTYRVAKRPGKNPVRVTINMDFTAGRLEDWDRAIKSYRRYLRVKIPERGSKAFDKAAIAASLAWEKIYKTKEEVFKDTIKGRLSYSVKPAPFWQILDKGTVGLKSDRGGFPTPTNKPTNFVFNAEKEVNDAIPQIISEFTGNIQQNIDSIQIEIDSLNAELDRLGRVIQNIRFEVGMQKKLAKELNIPQSVIDGKKLEKAIERAKSGKTGKMNIGIRKNPVYVYYKYIRENL